jgi:hypothetical protein
MDMNTAITIMDEAVKRHCTSTESQDFSYESDLNRHLYGWSYQQLRTYAAELVRVADEYILLCEAYVAANGGTAPGYDPTYSVKGGGPNGSI